MTKVVCAFIWEGQKVLIAQRPPHKSEPLSWEFPGGKIEPEESEQEAIVREIKEELALDVLPEERLGSVVSTHSQNTIELSCWKCRLLGGNIELREHKAFRWVEISELLSYRLSRADVSLVAVLNNMLPGM